MKRVILILAIILEILILAGIYDTHKKKSRGGDIVQVAMDNFVIKINGKERSCPRGTYVVTHEGFVRLYWYWVYQYWYLTVPFPIVLALILFMLGRSLKRKSTP